jgi:prolipoprotein diacylglyceryltransferase
MFQFIAEYRLYFLLIIPTVIGYFWLSQFKEKLRIKEWMALLISVLHTLIGVLCVKLFAFLEGGGFSGMSLYGAIIFLPLVYYSCARLSKRDVSAVFDIFTVCIIVTLLFARMNCLAAGCCLGLVIPGGESMRFPTREAELLFYIVLYIIFRKKVGKKQYKGKIYPYYMISYGAFRFVVEFFRETEMRWKWFHISHIWSLLAIVAGISAIYLIDKHNNKNKPHSKHEKHVKKEVN